MATVDLGKISFTQKGTWNSGTAYVAKDVVQYTDDNETSSYVAVASSTNETPSTNGTVNTSYWVLFAKGATVGSTNQGVWDVATAYQKNAVVQYTDSGVVSTYLAIADSTGETPSTAGTVNSTYWQLIAKGTDSVGLAWQSTIVTGTTLSAVAGNGYWINTTSNACTVTLPASASVGDTIEFVDYARTWGTNAVTINQVLNFQGATSENPIYNTNGQSVRIIYSGATQGWIPTSDDNVTDEVTPLNDIEYLVVAGGGGGGGCYGGGGGGAGGYRTGTYLNVAPSIAITVTIGSGGAAAPDSPTTGGSGGAGGSSSISGSGLTGITSAGGGYGRGFQSPSTPIAGVAGGSGSGGSSRSAAGGAGNTPSVSPSQGNNGGTGSSANLGGGGGGGAGAVGENGRSPSQTIGGGDGGIGTANSITGSSVYYAGGGAGAGEAGAVGGNGGNGGGGIGGSGPYSPSTPREGGPGTANTGGGGGGASYDVNYSTPSTTVSGAGGSGVVILKVRTSFYTGTTTGSPTVTDDGVYKVLKFTGSGSYTT